MAAPVEVLMMFSITDCTDYNILNNHSGAAFILYNSARIDKLIRTYDQNIASGHYSVPSESAIDWSLLKEEVNYILFHLSINLFLSSISSRF